MIEVAFALMVVVVVAALVLVALERQRVRRIAEERLHELASGNEPAELFPPERIPPFARRHRLLPWLAALAVFAALYFWFAWPLFYCLAFGVLVGLLGGQVDAMLLARRHEQIESQLADAIDLMVAAIKVGVSLPGALEGAARDAHRPLRTELDELVARIHYGDSPVEVLRDLAQRVPLETFRLFATSLIVNWQSGGNLAPTLAKVGRTIRDRIELARRLNAITMQARASVVSIILVTYFIAALMWRNNPERMVAFLSSMVGEMLAAFAIAMQGVGIIWISYISKPRF